MPETTNETTKRRRRVKACPAVYTSSGEPCPCVRKQAHVEHRCKHGIEWGVEYQVVAVAQPDPGRGELPDKGHTPMERAFLRHIHALEARVQHLEAGLERIRDAHISTNVRTIARETLEATEGGEGA